MSLGINMLTGGFSSLRPGPETSLQDLVRVSKLHIGSEWANGWDWPEFKVKYQCVNKMLEFRV